MSNSELSKQLKLGDYKRYGRQMILDGFGLPGQIKLLNSSVVVVGAGGLGCPALQYLAAAGVGRIRVIDGDVIEISNLQRQVLYSESNVSSHKAKIAAESLKRLNSRVQVDSVVEALTPSNAESLLSNHDIILDCTDNAPTRYLLSDMAVQLGKPLVSGAAQRFEGQICTYNLGTDGPCYRCLFPRAATAGTGTCEETGILGVVTGVIGCLQALEAIRILSGNHDEKPSLLLFSALEMPQFRTIKLRSRKPTCIACGPDGQQAGSRLEFDYEQFCGGATPNWEKRGMLVGEAGHRITAKEFSTVLYSDGAALVLDVRPRTEFGICQLKESVSVPLPELLANPASHVPAGSSKPVFVLCRLGNDSQIAADALRGVSGGDFVIKDVIGGLRAWTRDVDPTFPVY